MAWITAYMCVSDALKCAGYDRNAGITIMPINIGLADRYHFINLPFLSGADVAYATPRIRRVCSRAKWHPSIRSRVSCRPSAEFRCQQRHVTGALAWRVRHLFLSFKLAALACRLGYCCQAWISSYSLCLLWALVLGA